MCPDEIPPQNPPLFETEFKFVAGAESDGRYIILPKHGFVDGTTALDNFISWFDKGAEDARRRALAGETSPLEYHMWRRHFDVATLAQAAGFWQRTVRQHFRPEVFAKLPREKLARYASAMDIPDPESLRKIDNP